MEAGADLDKLVDLAISGSGEEKLKARTALLERTSDEEIAHIFSLLEPKPGGGFSGLRYLLIYLLKANSYLSYYYITALEQNPNPIISKAGQRAIRLMPTSDRADFLIQMLKSSYDRDVRRAAALIGEYGVNKGIDPLADLFRNSDDLILRDIIIEALGQVGHRRAIPVMESLLPLASRKERERLLAGLSQLGAGRWQWRAHRRWTRSPERDVAELGYYRLIRDRSFFWRRAIRKALSQADEELKREILLQVGAIRSHRLWKVIVGLAVREPRSELGILAASALERFPRPKSKRWLLAAEARAPFEQQSALLRFLSRYIGDRRVIDRLIKRATSSPSMAVRSVAMKQLKAHPKGVEALITLVDHEGIIGQRAAHALARSLQRLPPSLVESLTSKWSQLGSMRLTALLTLLRTTPLEKEASREAGSAVRAGLEDHRATVRYLAALAIPSVLGKEGIVDLVQLATQDLNRPVQRGALLMLEKIAVNHDALVEVVHQLCQTKRPTPLLRRLLRRIDRAFVSQEGNVKGVVSLFVEAHRSGRIGRTVVGLLGILAGRASEAYISAIGDEKWSDEDRLLLTEGMGASRALRKEIVDLRSMGQWYRAGSEEMRIKLRQLFKRVFRAHRPLFETLVQEIAQEEEGQARLELLHIVESWRRAGVIDDL